MNRPASIDEQLAQMQLFRELSVSQIRQVSNLATRITRPPGTVLMKEEQPGSEFIIVLDGEVEVRCDNRVVARRGSGDYLGEIALLENRPRTATAVAKTPLVVDVLTRREFWSLVRGVPDVSDQLHAAMRIRLAELDANPPRLLTDRT